jgi:hypothetical protein
MWVKWQGSQHTHSHLELNIVSIDKYDCNNTDRKIRFLNLNKGLYRVINCFLFNTILIHMTMFTIMNTNQNKYENLQSLHP